jgi:hypothetical protein
MRSASGAEHFDASKAARFVLIANVILSAYFGAASREPPERRARQALARSRVASPVGDSAAGIHPSRVAQSVALLVRCVMNKRVSTSGLTAAVLVLAAGCGAPESAAPGPVRSGDAGAFAAGGTAAVSGIAGSGGRGIASSAPSATSGAGGGLGQPAPVPGIGALAGARAPLPTPTPGAAGAASPVPGAPVPPAVPPMMPAPMMPAPRVPGQGTCLQGSGGYDSDGPYGAALTMDVELPGGLGPYTIFYPSSLEADCPHPIVSWGNGTGVTGSTTYAAYHRRAASWGIVTIASHNDNAGNMAFLEGGIDYLLAENANASSMFFGKLSDRAGVAGHSQGGIAATTAASHPNVQAEVCVQGGGFGVSANVAFMCQTGVDDFLRSMCTSTYGSAAGPSFLLDHQMADHVSTPTFGLTTSEPGMQYVTTATAWFRCWLADDESACAHFQGGASAPVCAASMWATCESRNF